MATRMVVVGGGTGGPSAAAKAKRLIRDLDVQMFEAGPHVSYAACPTPYYIADRIPDPDRLIARTPEAFEKAGVHVHLNTSVEAIDLKKGEITDSAGRTWPFDVLMYATGARSARPEVPGGDSDRVFTLKNLSDAMRIKEYVRRQGARRAVVLGGGFIAMEMSEAFRELGLETTVLYRGSLPVRRAGGDLSELILAELEAHGVRFVPDTQLREIVEEKNGVRVETNQGMFSADLVLSALGVRPNIALAEAAGIQIGKTGAVASDSHQRTNVPNVYTAGDCAEVLNRVTGGPDFYPLGDVANKQGRIAGSNIGGQETEFPGVVGSWCFKIFRLQVACTGLNEQEASTAGFQPVIARVTGRSRAESYPDSKEVHVRLVADRPTGRVLGVQIVAEEGAVGRANVVAACLHRNSSVEELCYMDLCYAPPFSPVWDPLHIAAQACLKQL